MNSSIDIVEALFGGHARTAILRLLARSDVPLTGRQIAELAGLSQPGAARALAHLASLGVVSRRRFGRAIAHELVRDNLLAQTLVIPVMDAEAHVLDSLEDDLSRTFAETVSAVLFGSMLERRGAPGGDIDVLVVAEDSDAAVDAQLTAEAAGAYYYRRYGAPLSAIVKTKNEVVRGDLPFVSAALRDGVTVAGAPLAEVLHAQR